MDFKLNKCCKNCPFKKGVDLKLSKKRKKEIVNGLLNDNTFSCHGTNTFHDDGYTTEKNHCFGAASVLAKIERPNQLMRIVGRCGENMEKYLNHKEDLYSLAEFIN
jgi:hypothetical protein